MDKYDNMLLKARAEMLGQHPLRKAPPHDALFSHVWNHVIKAPADDPYGLMQGYQDERNQTRQQQVQERTQSSPPPADPFGQMNEGASLDGPTQGMGANFRQGRSETRDPNKTGMMGRAKQGIGNFMNRLKRQPSQQTESTPPSLQEEQAPPGETRAFRDMPRAEYPPSFRMATSDQRGADGFPTRESVVRNARAGSDDLTEWDRMNALREQREAETQAEQGTDLRAATRAKMTEPQMPSPMREAQEMKTPVEAGMDAMREPVDNDFYNRFAGVEEQPMRQPQPEAPAPVEEQREFVDPFGQMNGLEEQQGELPPDFNTEIEPTQENQNWWDGIEGADVMEEARGGEPEMFAEMYEADQARATNEDEYPESPTDLDVLDREAAEVEEQEERLTKPLPTGRKGVKGLLTNRAPKNRQLPESVGDTETGEMAGIAGRKGFNEVNNRDEKKKREQQPNARSKGGRLEQKARGEKRMAARSVDPTEATEKVLNPPKSKKAAPKKAKKSPAAKAVKATASKRKAKAKPLEGTEEMREEAPPKKKTGTKAMTEDQKKKIGEVAERVEAKPRKDGKKSVGAAAMRALAEGKDPAEAGKATVAENVESKKKATGTKAKTSKAKPKKGSALASVNAVAEQRKKGADTDKPFANKAKPARQRNKNPKKTAIEGLGEAAARSRTRQAAKAKKNEPSEESAPEKEYGLSISGGASESDISEIMEAARSGNKSAQSAIYNNAGTLEDSHGLSADEIQEASGR